MLRTPTHFVELGSNSSNPLIIQTFHKTANIPATVAAATKASSNLPNTLHCDLYHNEFGVCSEAKENNNNTNRGNTKLMIPIVAAKHQHQPPPQQSFLRSHFLNRRLLTNSPFSFKKSKKIVPKDYCDNTNQTSAEYISYCSNNNNINKPCNNFCNYFSNNNNKSNCNVSNKFKSKNKKSTTSSTTTPKQTSEYSIKNTNSSRTSLSSVSAESTFSLPFSNISADSSASASTCSGASATAPTTYAETPLIATTTTSFVTTSLATASSSSSSSPLLTPASISSTSPTTTTMSPTSQTPTRTSLFNSCHRKIRLIGGVPVAFLGGLVAKARRKERDGDQNSTDTKLYLEESVLERKLPDADLKALVDLPAGLDYNEWLASHTLALFEHVNLVYGTISEFCTPTGCPDMTGPTNRTYLWFDEKGKKTRVAAPQYIDYVMTFTQKTVSDESIFPTKYANEFPSSFDSIARKILRLLFHVIAHLYAVHFREIALLGLHTHLNLTFAHLTALHRRFGLIDEKETEVLRDLEVALRLTDDSGTATVAMDTDNISPTSGSATANAIAPGSRGLQDDCTNAAATTTTTTTVIAVSASAALIDGDAEVAPICTQPEAGQNATDIFVGAGSLMGGILGDLSSGEFGGDATIRYCASAVSMTAVSTSSAAEVASMENCNNGAGALHLNLNINNNNNNHQHHPQLHHTHTPQTIHHHHPSPHLNPPQNSGLIQCNVSTAPNSISSSSSSSNPSVGVASMAGSSNTTSTTA